MSKLGRSQYLLANSAARTPEASENLFRQWLSENNLDDVRGPDLRMLPLIFANLGDRLKDHPAHVRLKGVSRHVLLANRLRMEQCGKFIDLLQSKKIPVVLLKGSAMIVAVAGDVGHRMMADCDILIPRDRAEEAIQHLHESGLRSLPIDAASFNHGQLGQHHGLSFRTGARSDDIVDVHWRPLREIENNAFTMELFEHARPLQFARRLVAVPAFEHMLIQAALHSYSARSEGRYDWLVDLSLILRNRTINWPMIESSAERYEFSALLSDALQEAKEIVGADVPLHVIDRLKASSSALEKYELRKFKAGSVQVRGDIILTLQRLRRRHLGAKKYPGKALASALWDFISPRPTHVVNSAEGNSDADFIHGWSFFESTGRWSIGNWSLLRLTVNPATPRDSLRILATSVSSWQSAKIYFGWRSANFWWSDDCCHIFVLPRSLRKKSAFNLLFHIKRAASPRSLWDLPDERELGLRILDIRTSPPLRDILKSDFRFDLDGGEIGALWKGWSMPDENGCWSAGNVSELRWQASSNLPAGTCLALNIKKIEADDSQPLELKIFCNGQVAGTIALNHLEAIHQFKTAAPVSAGEDISIVLRFEQKGKRKTVPRIFLAGLSYMPD
jgi:hypothetical protein